MTIRRMYPLVLMGEFIIVPIILSVEKLFSIGLWIVLVIELIVSVAVAVIPVYGDKLGNVRNYVHRGLVLGVTGAQIMEMYLMKENIDDAESMVYLMPFVLLSILVLGLLSTGSFILYRSYIFYYPPSQSKD